MAIIEHNQLIANARAIVGESTDPTQLALLEDLSDTLTAMEDSVPRSDYEALAKKYKDRFVTGGNAPRKKADPDDFDDENDNEKDDLSLDELFK